MRTIFALALMLTGCVSNTAEDTKFQPFVVSENWGQDFYYASQSASGSKLCDRDLANHYGQLFEKRFGERLRQLRVRFEQRYGQAPDFIVTSDCRGFRGSVDAQDRYYQRARAYFDRWLTSAEKSLAP
jgi:hypothetical protein